MCAPPYIRAFIALGSNLGDRAGTIRAALGALQDAGDTRVLKCSSLHETRPVGGPPGQPLFLNAVAELETRLPPRELLGRMLDIETRHGRVRDVPNGPRTLDLDLLLYGDEIIDEPGLCVPHPRMWEREFVLAPLREVCDRTDFIRFERLSASPTPRPARLRADGTRRAIPRLAAGPTGPRWPR